MPMDTTLGRMVTYLDGLKHKVMQHFDQRGLYDYSSNKNDYTSTTKVFLATKLDRIVTYLDRLLSI